MDAYAVCRALLSAESEAEVSAIIDQTPEMKNPENWGHLDQRDTNSNVVTNQATTGGKAATELMTNMVDAILTKCAYEAGIDPKGPDAPRTMHDAVKKLVKEITVSKLVDEDHRALREYASKNLVIGITGKTKGGSPCYTFADNGEGQLAENFENSFLSLSARNKKDIPFVQGKYNMGSSGVLNFCGKHWYKLIVSRRYDKSGPWAFTLMRKRSEAGMLPVADYFIIGGIRGEIATFEADDVHPFRTGSGDRYDGFHLGAGTIIKLYDFHIGKKYQSFRGAREAFNENLTDTVLPFRILDFRQKPDPNRGGDRKLGIDPRPFYGMEYLLRREHADAEDESDSEEEGPAGEKKELVVDIDNPELGRIEISAIPLKRGKPKWLQSPNINRIFHSVNGQVQFKQKRGFLTTCKLPALKDRVVILVDASNLTDEAHKAIWKGDREQIIENDIGEKYNSVIKEELTNSEVLKDLQQRVAKEELTQATNQQQNELFQELVNKDRQIAAMLQGNDPTIILHGEASDDEDEPYKGEVSPSFLDIEDKSKIVEVPVNSSRLVIGHTDAVNDYFIRADNRGEIQISDKKFKENFSVSKSLKNGRLLLGLKPKEGGVSEGDKFDLDVSLYDAGMSEPVSDALTVCIVGPKDKSEPRSRPDPKSKKKKPSLGLPPYVLLTKDGRKIGNHPCEEWPDWVENTSGGDIVDLPDGQVIYKINHDNSYHLKYRQAARGEVEKDAITEKYVAGMRLVMLGLEHAFKQAVEQKKREGGENWLSDNDTEIRRLAARGAASTVLALAEHLPKIAGAPEEEPE